MASIQEAIKRLTWMFTSSGADKVADDLNKVGAAQANVAASAQTTEKASLSLEKSFDSLERRYVSTVRAQQDFEKVQNTVNAAVKQNPELQERANVVLANAAAKFDAAKGSATGFNAILEAGRGAALGYAAGIGPIGALLGSFGPWGIAAAAGIGVVNAALNFMSEGAKRAGDEASSLKRFSDTAGLTITQVRGITQAGSELGIGADQISGALGKFTANLDEARNYGGALFDKIKEINPALAVQLAATHDGAEAWDILAKAINSTTDATTKAKLGQVAFGKGGQGLTGLAGVTGEAGGIDAYSAAAEQAVGVTGEWSKRVAELSNQAKSLASDLELVKASTYAEAALTRQVKLLEQELSLAKAVRDVVGNGGNIPQNSSDAMGTALPIAPPQAVAPSASDFGARYSDAAGQIKAANDATAQFTASTDLLSAAQSRANEALARVAEVESSSIAPANALAAARKSAGDALSGLAVVEAQRIQILGGAATGDEILKQKTDALTGAMMQGKITADDYNRALHGDTANQVAALQDQLSVIQAVGFAQKSAAQYAADYNAALRGGKDSLDAEVIASEKLANSQAAAYAAAQKTVQSSQDNLDSIKAQGTGMEGVVASSIAYRDAIQAGATATQAAAISANTLQASMIQAGKAAQQVVNAGIDKANGTVNGISTQASWQQWVSQHESPFTPHIMPSGTLSFQPTSTHPVTYTNGGAGFRMDTGEQIRPMAVPTSDSIANDFVGRGDYSGAISAVGAMRSGVNRDGSTNGYDASAQMSQVDTLTQLLNSQTSDKGTQLNNLQKEMAWLNTLPETIARDQKIVSLQQSIDSLKNSTDANTAATQATLNPLYSQGHGALAIGYYKAAGGLDMVAQGPTSGDQIPFHAMVNGGENIKITPAGKSSNDNTKSTQIINNNNFVFNNATTSNARRSYRQFSQGFGQLAAAGS